MKILLIAAIFIFPGWFKGNAQTNLTKEEILLSWASYAAKDDTIQDVRNITFSPSADKRISFLIDSLKSKGVDSIIIYSVAYLGYYSTDTCTNYIYPVYSYLLWTSDKAINIKTIKGKCETSVTKIDSSNIFNYYRNNKESITKEIVMPVISSAKRIDSDKITYSVNRISHEPNYLMYLICANTFKTISFTENDIQNEKSLFHEHNLNLKSIKLWELIKTEIEDNRI